MSINLKNQNDIVNSIIAALISNNPDSITDYNIGSVLRTIIEAIAEKIGYDGDVDSLYKQAYGTYLNSRIDTATSDSLDQLGSLVGVTRFTGGSAEGDVTFRAPAKLTSDLIIPANTQVGTVPNDENGQKIFNVTNDTTFYSSVTAEEHTFINGIFDYPLNQRFIDSVSGLSGISGGNNFVFTENTDFTLQENYDDYIVDTSKAITNIELFENIIGYSSNEIVTMDSCDATTSWGISGTNSVALNTTAGERKEGTGCINIVKSDGTSDKCTVYKTLLSSADISSKEVSVWYYIYDKTKISSIKMIAGQDSSNFYYNTYLTANLVTGWNRLTVNSLNTQFGSPATTNVDYVALDITTANASDTFAGNQQRMDYWFNDTILKLNNTDFKQGSYSASPAKLSTSYDYVYYDKALTSTSIYGQDMNIKMKIKDTTTKNKISKIEFYLGNVSSNIAFIYTIDKDNITTIGSWVDYFLTAYKTNGSPSPSIIDFIRIKIYTINATDTLAYDDILFDNWIFGTLRPYYGDIIHFVGGTGVTLPDTNTTFKTTYVPLSWEVDCTAVASGTGYNVSKNKIVYKVTYLTTIESINNYDAMTGGTDAETDTALRTRIKANSIAGRATVHSIKTALENVEQIRSANVIELPERSGVAETHTYVSGTPGYQMLNKVIIDDANWVVSGVSGGSGITFVKNTDYTVSPEDNKIYFGTSGAVSLPDNSSIFYTNYHYNALGFIDVYVAGEQIPMSLATSGLVSGAIDNYKGGGVVLNWYEPTIKYITINATVTLQTGYLFSTIQSQVESAVSNYIGSLGVGENVLASKVIAAIMSVTGIANTTLVDISGGGAVDYTIGDNQIAKPSTFTITQN